MEAFEVEFRAIPGVRFVSVTGSYDVGLEIKPSALAGGEIVPMTHVELEMFVEAAQKALAHAKANAPKEG